MTSAEYGHISVGKCISEEDPRYIGCSNDVLPLFDKWCSGKRECTFGTPNEDIDRMNNNCPNFLLKYLSLHHDCIEGQFCVCIICLIKGQYNSLKVMGNPVR